jgi:ribosome-associated translation inhibitor RaiA
MSVSVSFRGIEPPAQSRLREIFNAHAQRLRSRLERFSPETWRLEGAIEKRPEREAIHVSLRLRLPGRLLTAAAEGTDLKAVLTAFDELEHRLDRHRPRRSLASSGHAAAH